MSFKTNAMRILETNKIAYVHKEYAFDESDLSGTHAASELGLDPKTVYKTLVTGTDKKAFYVFCIPVDEELDLKKCAVAAGEKKLEMIHVKDLLSLTGYIRGGCSPIGMKKPFPTFLSAPAENLATIYVSAGQRGHQIGLSPRELAGLLHAKFASITTEDE